MKLENGQTSSCEAFLFCIQYQAPTPPHVYDRLSRFVIYLIPLQVSMHTTSLFRPLNLLQLFCSTNSRLPSNRTAQVIIPVTAPASLPSSTPPAASLPPPLFAVPSTPPPASPTPVASAALRGCRMSRNLPRRNCVRGTALGRANRPPYGSPLASSSRRRGG